MNNKYYEAWKILEKQSSFEFKSSDWFKKRGIVIFKSKIVLNGISFDSVTETEEGEALYILTVCPKAIRIRKYNGSCLVFPIQLFELANAIPKIIQNGDKVELKKLFIHDSFKLLFHTDDYGNFYVKDNKGSRHKIKLPDDLTVEYHDER